jgi:hypothetical protein
VTERWRLLGCYAVWRLVLIRSVRRLLVKASVVPISLILGPLMTVALSSYEPSVITRAPWRNSPDDAILQNLIFVSVNVCRAIQYSISITENNPY